MGARHLETRQFDSGKWNAALFRGWHSDQFFHSSHAGMLGRYKRSPAASTGDRMRTDDLWLASGIFGYLAGNNEWFPAHGSSRAGENHGANISGSSSP